jgi:hypothetical protein
MLKLARLAWLSPVPIAVRSGRINRSYIGKYELLSLAEEKAQTNVGFNIAIEPPSFPIVRMLGGPYRIARATPLA